MFPRPTGRGLIEATYRAGYARVACCFRGQPAAASLKPDPASCYSRGICVFPRPTGRGLIEASTRTARRRSICWFPRPTGRGLIEAWYTARKAYASPTFPRPTGRGLIEARCEGAGSATGHVPTPLNSCILRMSPEHCFRMR